MCARRQHAHRCGSALIGPLFALAVPPASARGPQVSNASTVYDEGGWLTTTAWHARTLTNISWNIPPASVDPSQVILLSWDRDGTDLWRFGDEDDRILPSSSSSATSFIPPISADQPYDEACNFHAFFSSSNDTFYSEDLYSRATVDIGDGSTWFYTNSLAQERSESISASSAIGNASVALGEPGLYVVCLQQGGEVCVECSSIIVYQPLEDFVEVS